MYTNDFSDEHRPVLWVRGYPVYGAHFVVALFVLCMLATTILLAANAGGFLNALVFDNTAVLAGQLWRVVTYGFVNVISSFESGLNFAIHMWIIASFGRELERVLGRTKFLTFFGCLYLLSPLVLTVLGPWLPYRLAGERGALAVFVAFAIVYPNVPVFFSILAKWAAAIAVGIYTVAAISRRDMADLISLWVTVAFAFAFIRHHQGLFSLPTVRIPKKSPKLRVLQGGAAGAPTPRPSPRDTPMAEVDALLDKIAQTGIGSLTPSERAKLDAAQADLLRRKGRS